MGQLISSGDTEVTIVHKFAADPPPGWKVHGYVRFHVNGGERMRDLVRKINEYRSPSHQITTLKDSAGNPVPTDTKIPLGRIIYYV